jgi:hypothetical protein
VPPPLLSADPASNVGSASRRLARTIFSNAGAESSSMPRRLSTSSSASTSVPERICCSPSSLELSSQASWNSGEKFGDSAGVRPLPRLN